MSTGSNDPQGLVPTKMEVTINIGDIKIPDMAQAPSWAVWLGAAAIGGISQDPDAAIEAANKITEAYDKKYPQ